MTPAPFTRDGIRYVFDFDESYRRTVFTEWKEDPVLKGWFTGYACQWPDGTLTHVPDGEDLETWLTANPKKPEETT